MKRSAIPTLSPIGQQALRRYLAALHEGEDLSPVSVRNYLPDPRQFAAWCEATWADGREAAPPFAPAALTTPTLTRYRGHLQRDLGLKPASVNRALISLKRYATWAVEAGLLTRDPARPVKLVPAEAAPPRYLEDGEEDALVAPVTATGTLRDRTIITLLLHTGPWAREPRGLRREHAHLGRRSGHLVVIGKRNKYRAVPLNATARAALADWLAATSGAAPALFPSTKTGAALTARALDDLVTRYARRARLTDLYPHDPRHRFGYRMAARATPSASPDHGPRLAGYHDALQPGHAARFPARGREHRLGVTGAGLRPTFRSVARHDPVYARYLPRFRQPDSGLTLHRRFARAGLAGRDIVPLVVPITDVALLRLYGLDSRSEATSLVAEGRLDRERAEAALASLDDASRDGIFCAHLPAFLAAGRVPAP